MSGTDALVVGVAFSLRTKKRCQRREVRPDRWPQSVTLLVRKDWEVRRMGEDSQAPRLRRKDLIGSAHRASEYVSGNSSRPHKHPFCRACLARLALRPQGPGAWVVKVVAVEGRSRADRVRQVPGTVPGLRLRNRGRWRSGAPSDVAFSHRCSVCGDAVYECGPTSAAEPLWRAATAVAPSCGCTVPAEDEDDCSKARAYPSHPTHRTRAASGQSCRPRQRARSQDQDDTGR